MWARTNAHSHLYVYVVAVHSLACLCLCDVQHGIIYLPVCSHSFVVVVAVVFIVFISILDDHCQLLVIRWPLFRLLLFCFSLIILLLYFLYKYFGDFRVYWFWKYKMYRESRLREKMVERCCMQRRWIFHSWSFAHISRICRANRQMWNTTVSSPLAKYYRSVCVCVWMALFIHIYCI